MFSAVEAVIGVTSLMLCVMCSVWCVYRYVGLVPAAVQHDVVCCVWCVYRYVGLVPAAVQHDVVCCVWCCLLYTSPSPRD